MVPLLFVPTVKVAPTKEESKQASKEPVKDQSWLIQASRSFLAPSYRFAVTLTRMIE